MMDWFAKDNLRKLNSLTKYPSIPTYHAMGDRGMLQENDHVDFGDESVWITEKIDGNNSRLVVLPKGDFLIGSREELLYAKGDRVINPTLGVVDIVLPYADTVADKINVIRESMYSDNAIWVFYMESYGGNIGKAAKQYSKKGDTHCRLFDIAMISPAWDMLEKMTLEQISTWREHGGCFGFEGHAWHVVSELPYDAEQYGFDTVPEIGICNGRALPESLEGMLELLQAVLPESNAVLDQESDGKPEGIVVRTPDRSKIAKIRYEDYERTLKRLQKAAS